MLEKEVLNFEKTAIVGIVTQNQSEEKLTEYLNTQSEVLLISINFDFNFIFYLGYFFLFF